eukprot:g78070.t1
MEGTKQRDKRDKTVLEQLNEEEMRLLAQEHARARRVLEEARQDINEKLEALDAKHLQDCARLRASFRKKRQSCRELLVANDNKNNVNNKTRLGQASTAPRKVQLPKKSKVLHDVDNYVCMVCRRFRDSGSQILCGCCGCFTCQTCSTSEGKWCRGCKQYICASLRNCSSVLEYCFDCSICGETVCRQCQSKLVCAASSEGPRRAYVCTACEQHLRLAAAGPGASPAQFYTHQPNLPIGGGGGGYADHQAIYRALARRTTPYHELKLSRRKPSVNLGRAAQTQLNLSTAQTHDWTVTVLGRARPGDAGLGALACHHDAAKFQLKFNHCRRDQSLLNFHTRLHERDLTGSESIINVTLKYLLLY